MARNREELFKEDIARIELAIKKMEYLLTICVGEPEKLKEVALRYFVWVNVM